MGCSRWAPPAQFFWRRDQLTRLMFSLPPWTVGLQLLHSQQDPTAGTEIISITRQLGRQSF